MSAVHERLRLDPARYLEWEAQQTDRHELVDGEVYAMTGARDAHNRVALNIASFLKSALRGTPCRTFMADMKLHIDSPDAYVYPDVFVTCDERDRTADADLAKRHAVVVAEVLSESTAAYDRGRKFELYRSLAELRELLFVEPERMSIDLFRRDDGGLWVLHPLQSGREIRLQSLQLALPVEAIYEDVLPAAPT